MQPYVHSSRESKHRWHLQAYGADAAATAGNPATWTSTKPLWTWVKDWVEKRVVRRSKAPKQGESRQALPR